MGNDQELMESRERPNLRNIVFLVDCSPRLWENDLESSFDLVFTEFSKSLSRPCQNDWIPRLNKLNLPTSRTDLFFLMIRPLHPAASWKRGLTDWLVHSMLPLVQAHTASKLHCCHQKVHRNKYFHSRLRPRRITNVPNVSSEESQVCLCELLMHTDDITSVPPENGGHMLCTQNPKDEQN